MVTLLTFVSKQGLLMFACTLRAGKATNGHGKRGTYVICQGEAKYGHIDIKKVTKPPKTM